MEANPGFYGLSRLFYLPISEYLSCVPSIFFVYYVRLEEEGALLHRHRINIKTLYTHARLLINYIAMLFEVSIYKDNRKFF